MYVLYLSEQIQHGTKNRKQIVFNSVAAARKFMTEKLNEADKNGHLEKLRANKKVEISRFNQCEPGLFRYYGMLDMPIQTIVHIETMLSKNETYIYRIGNQDSAFRTIPSLLFTLEPAKTN